tara:strand:+ start:108 stop:524 length:417 start_codon:yes stop_codon:yes gene_type:complete
MSKLIEQLKRHEGLVLQPYRCTEGKLTIGYGRNLDSNGISKLEAEKMLYNDVDETIDNLNNLIPDIMMQLNQARKGVIINMAFNLGIHGLLKFKKMIAALEVGDYDEAAIQMMDSKWARQVGKRAIELSEQMRTGKYL